MKNYSIIVGVIKFRQRKHSIRECQARFKIGSSTVHLILDRFKDSGLSLEDLEKMKPEEVENLIYPPLGALRKPEALPDYESIYQKIHTSGSKANLYYLWKEYRVNEPDGYQYTQFVEHYNRYVEKTYGAKDVSMAVERVPGEKMYIDWVGDQPAVLVNSQTGEASKVHLFVTTIGVSSKVYVEAFPNEKQFSFVKGTVHAVESYGAIAKYFVPDNCKTAVTKHTKDELVINSSYQDLESFYDVVILPPPARKPTGKATVERYVQYVETAVIEKLKENTYYSLESINEAIKKIVADINDEIPKGYDKSHNEMFELYDKPQMKPLSHGSFSECDYVYFSSVPRNYHLLYDDHYYSVFYTYYKKPVILKATFSEIKICDKDNRLLCTHKRAYSKFPKYITLDDHMPAQHKYYKEINEHDGDYYRRWAGAIGMNMKTLIERVLLSVKHEEQAYNSCNGILHMCTGVSPMLVDKAAARCIELNACKYSYFKKTLKEVMNNEDDPTDSLPEHENLWGEDYYK